MFGTIDRVMAKAASSVLAAVIEGFAAYASSIHMPAAWDDVSPSSREFPSSPRRK